MSLEDELSKVLADKITEVAEELSKSVTADMVMAAVKEPLGRLIDGRDHSRSHYFSDKVLTIVTEEVAHKYVSENYVDLVKKIDLDSLQKILHLKIAADVKHASL